MFEWYKISLKISPPPKKKNGWQLEWCGQERVNSPGTFYGVFFIEKMLTALMRILGGASELPRVIILSMYTIVYK